MALICVSCFIQAYLSVSMEASFRQLIAFLLIAIQNSGNPAQLQS